MIHAVTPVRSPSSSKSRQGSILIVVWALEQDPSLAGTGSARKAGKKGATSIDVNGMVIENETSSSGALIADEPRAEQDVFVSWERQIKDINGNGKGKKTNGLSKGDLLQDDAEQLSRDLQTKATISDSTTKEEQAEPPKQTFQRYYHLFKHYELAGLVAQAAQRLKATFKQPAGYPEPVVMTHEEQDGNSLLSGGAERQQQLVVELEEERWERENWVAVVKVGWL